VSQVQTGTITTRVPARLDRLPWSRWHWRALGAPAARPLATLRTAEDDAVAPSPRTRAPVR
jgi:hypothetical protein